MNYFWIVLLNLFISSSRILPLPFLLTIEEISNFYLTTLYFVWFSSIPTVIFTLFVLPLLAKSRFNDTKTYLSQFILKVVGVTCLLEILFLAIIHSQQIIDIQTGLIITVVTIFQSTFYIYQQLLHSKNKSQKAQLQQLYLNLIGAASIYTYLYFSDTTSTNTIILLLYLPYFYTTIKLISFAAQKNRRDFPRYVLAIDLRQVKFQTAVVSFMTEGVKNAIRQSLEIRAPLVLYVMQLVSWLMQPIQTLLHQYFNRHILNQFSGTTGRHRLVTIINRFRIRIAILSISLLIAAFSLIAILVPYLQTSTPSHVLIGLILLFTTSEVLRFLVGLWNFMGLAAGRINDLLTIEFLYLTLGILPMIHWSGAWTFVTLQLLTTLIVICLLIYRWKQNAAN